MADYNLGTAHGIIEIDSNTKGIDQAERSMEGLRKSSQTTEQALDKTSRGMGIAGAAVAGGLGLAVKTAMDFDKQLSAIAAVGGKEAVSRMGEIREQALKIGAETSFSASEAAMAMEELVKAGIPVSDVLNGAADATVALAAAGGVDLPTAAGLASNAMNQFNLTADDLVGVTDTIAQAANASAIDVGELGMSMSQVGAVANLAGLSFDETAIAIGQLGDAGIKGSDAGTSLKTMLSNLQPTTKKQTDLMTELGLVTEDGANQFYNAQGELKPLRDIQQLLMKSTAGLTDAQKQMALETIFGSDAIRAAAVLADGGAASYDNFTEKMAGVGSAADVAKTRQDNLAGSIEQLKGSAETLGIQLGSALTPMIRSLADALTSVVNWFSSLDEGTQQWLVGTLAVVAALLLTTAGILKMVNMARSLMTTLRTLRILSTATQTGFIRMAASGIASFVKMAVSASIQAAKTVASWVVATARIAARWAWMAVQATINAARVGATWLITAGAQAAAAVAQTAMAAARIVASWVLMGVQAMARAVMMAAAWFIALGPIGWAIAALIAVIAFVIIFWDEIKAAFAAAGQWLAAMMTKLWGAIVRIWNSIIAWFKRIPGWIKGIFASAASWLISAGRSVINGLWNGVKAIWNSALAFLRGIPGLIKNVFSGAGSWLLSVGGDLIRGLWNGISNVTGWIMDKIGGFVDSVVSGIKNFFGIGSPSKLFEDEVGRWLPAGIAVGIESNADDALRAASSLVDAVSGSVSMSASGPDAFWDARGTGPGYVPPSREVAAYSAAQGDPGGGSTRGEVKYEFNTYNPVAERASDSTARRLRGLASLGAFGEDD